MEDTKQTKKSDDVREALRERMRQMEQHMGALRRELTGAVSPVKEVITRHPVGSACTVLGVGVALGYLIASGRRSDESDQTEILDAALAPVIEAVREHLDQGEHSGEAVQRNVLTRNDAVPRRTESTLSQLVQMLAPVVVEMGIRALNTESKDQEG
ncbi:MAG: hypothetical protein F4146_07535 [Rhodothermaceae bacterium]|nr:hypothetical protein [Rhodothermaceae bacterium]MYF40242.1 hypothetical protein [Rhodothermaceae bacterium]MYH08362.1 hypothetical protein [Rhodothermaceae bacterium]